MDRLTRKEFEDTECEPYVYGGIEYYGDSYGGEVINKLAEYEDLEEQGLLLKLPYPFGTKLYYVIDDWDYGMSVNEIIFDLEFISDVLKYPNEYYLTKEEAEEELAKMKEV